MRKAACLPDTVPGPRAVLPHTLKFTEFGDKLLFVRGAEGPPKAQKVIG